MRNFLLFTLLLGGLFSFIITNFVTLDENYELLLDNSGPYIGAEFPKQLGFTGKGVKIGVIDTGINLNHPDFFNQDQTSRFLKGYDFVDNDTVPQDTNGHGTQVTGIIAADGQLKGIAPMTEIFSYRVSSDGESVPSNLIIKAINQAIEDKVDIINISLGVNMTHNKIDEAVNNAINQGIVVVAAAGNSGPEKSTIGSPARNPNAVTVGATYNNQDSSMVSTLVVGETQFQVLPMLGTDIISDPISADIIFGKYSRDNDFDDIDVRGKIVLAERGGELNEIVFFSDKEIFASKNGAKGLIVYNNQPGIFFGELIHEYVSADYYPSIPTVSMTREEGLELKKILETETSGTLNIFNHPDFIATFSSRGPVSPFYQKPDLVAPGVFVNTTSLKNFYNITSGTSYAAPHVSGAIALLLEKNPDLTPQEIKSILVTTSNIITDQYNKEFEFNAGGAGRIDLKKAFNSKLIFEPPKLIFNLSEHKISEEQEIKINSLNGIVNIQKVKFSDVEGIKFDYEIKNSTLYITAKLIENESDIFETRALITDDDDVVYQIPIIVRVNEATIVIIETENEISFQIKQPLDWEYAKITITNSETFEERNISITPKKIESLKLYDAGRYWIEANVKSNENTFDVYEVYDIKEDLSEQKPIVENSELPERALIILGIIFSIVIVVGLKFRKNY
ncbi:MAG: S8 family serine peptidase [Thaumarchaeota archaeon]|jgi:minor extracellular serine protease Vpr|nr:S8 family serine peptidase [Nitrososphaerota archaeon]MBT3744208.1 S8 family serine peptidase [Nitrososphaerota archaeon]MBT4056966.1 S8 family serine peptidase [Nitrososphaerota archaeon]MBT4176127.1 S8 family serine peptidase [Nitrososphaerota archaeon]MBT4510061.1 S8 family serine peptidase [Nitrososphaerota archaeon]